MGAAAIVGSQRITLATLDTEVTNLSQNVKQYHNPSSLSAAQQTQDTLTWLIRFQINEQLARAEGITVSAAQAQTALAQVDAEAKSELESEGVSNASLNYILSYIGIPPNLATEVGRYQAIDTQFIEQVNGGKVPTATAAQTATTAKLTRAQCVAAKALQIQINPQFGRLNYSQYEVVSGRGRCRGRVIPAGRSRRPCTSHYRSPGRRWPSASLPPSTGRLLDRPRRFRFEHRRHRALAGWLRG
jgi:hypothetical protein